MIITKKIDIKINKGNISLYKKKMPNTKLGDIVSIDIDGLSKGSNVEILAKCDICDNERFITYKLYNKSFDKNGIFVCGKKCAFRLRTNKVINDYGVNNISQIPSIKEKIKETNIKKYGGEYFVSSQIGIDKIKNTFLQKYGIDNPQKNVEIRKKTNKTNNIKYGSNSSLHDDEVKMKSKETNRNRYGFEYPSKNESIKSKLKQTNNIKYGGNSPMSNHDILTKSRTTLSLNYGVDNPQKSDEIKEKTKNTLLEKYGVEYLSQSDVIKQKIKSSLLEKYSGHTSYIPLCTICYPIDDKVSIQQNEIFNFIKSIYNGNIITGYRDDLEIDIYLPDLNLGFEFNGLYFHSEKFKDKNYHLNKTLHFKKRGIRIIHLWEDDWIAKREIIKSQIGNSLGLTNNKIYARNCEIIEVVNTKLVRKFLDENHIQGFVNSNIKLGLFYNGELVSLMTFDKFEGRNKLTNNEWNLYRFCSKINTIVVGAFSKLLNHFINKNRPSRIISYADRSWSLGESYVKLGFVNISESGPDYKYIINGARLHKSRFKKNKLKTNLSESEFMNEKNILKIWDCGKIKLELLFH